MAKKTAKKTPKKSDSKPAKKKASKKAAAPKKPALSDEQIGAAAGEVWGALAEAGPLTLAALKKAVDQPGELTLLGLGWLAREGKLEYPTKGRSLKIALR